MKLILVFFMSLLNINLLAMDDSIELAEQYSSILNNSDNIMANDVLTFAFKNDTGVLIKMRGRFGPTNEDPLGYICEENNPNAAQIFILKPDQKIKFNIKKKYLPLRVRIWHFSFFPDDDMNNDKPIQSSQCNILNSIFSIALDDEKYDFEKNKIIISLQWDTVLQSYLFALEKVEENSEDSYEIGYTNHYKSLSN